MKLLTNISLLNRRQWEELVNRSSVANIFQTPAMCDFYASGDSGRLRVVGVEENDTLKGVVACMIFSEGSGLKKRLTSRAVINGGPLLADDISSEALTRLLQFIASEVARDCVYVETRNYNDYSRWKKVFETCGFDYEPHYNFHIDTSEKEVEKRFDKSRRKRIRKALESGATISEDLIHLPAFYEILSDLYHTKVRKPLPAFKVFQQLTDTPMAKCFFVLDPEGKTIGGQLMLTLDHRVAYAWYCCGLDQEYRDLHPSIMANYAAIRYAANQGFGRFDMMGAGKPGDKYGVREFKAQFGGELVEHGRFLHVNRRLVYSLGKLYVNLKSKS